MSMEYLQRFSNWPRAHVLAAAIAMVGFIGVFDYVSGSEISVGIFYLIPVSIAAWSLDIRTGIFIATASAVVWFACDVTTQRSYSHPFVPVWNASVRFGFFFLFAVLLAAFKNAWVQRLERDIEIAREIQQRLLPRSVPSWPGLDIAVRLLPAERLSGDYYDFSEQGEDRGILVADVAGKGLPASLLMANLHALFHSAHYRPEGSEDICAMIQRMNRHMITFTQGKHFATLIHADFPAQGSHFTYVSAGHTPALLWREGDATWLSATGLPVGVLPEADWSAQSLDLPPGGVLLLYTDGLSEAANATGEFYGRTQLLEHLDALARRTRSAKEILDGMLADLNVWTQGTHSRDDMLLLVVRRPLPKGAPSDGVAELV